MTTTKGFRLFSISVTAMAAVLGAQGASATDITGSGSTFVNPIMLRWASSFYAKTGVKVHYLAIGSGSGLAQVKAGQSTFGASDKPLSSADLKAADLIQFPLVVGGVVVVVNLDGIEPGQLRLTGELLADMYLGKVTRWTDPAVAALNPELKLPDLPIAVTHRSDASGTTFNFVNYLGKMSAQWKTQVGEGTLVKWPGGMGGSGNEGVARYVKYAKGSIGYVELAYAIQNKMTYASLRNRSGSFVMPSLESFEAAAASATWTSPDFFQLLTDAPGPQSWPITATTFALMPRLARDPARAAEAFNFFKYALDHGKAEARKLNYVPLPDVLVRQIEASWEAGK